MTLRALSILLLSLALAACGGGGGSEGSGGEGSSGGERADETEGFDMEGFEEGDPQVDHGTQSARELLGVQGPETPWDEMSHDQQVEYMIAYVLPIAAEDFRGYDAARYRDMECNTCHGDDAEERHYEMPSASLPPLPEPGSEGWTRMEERNPRGVQFMTETVTPTVGTQLGESDFGCFDCHPHG